MSSIRITFKEAQEFGLTKVTIKMTEDGLEYYRPLKPLYIVISWLDDNNCIEKHFSSLKAAKNYGKKNFSNYDIDYYEDKSDRYWKVQYQFVDKKLIGVERQ